MVGALIGALCAYVGLAQFLDDLLGTDASSLFAEKIGSVIMFFLQPLISLLTSIYDGALAIITSFFTS